MLRPSARALAIKPNPNAINAIIVERIDIKSVRISFLRKRRKWYNRTFISENRTEPATAARNRQLLKSQRGSELPAEGIEPTRSCDHWILSPARLPVPPRRRKEREA